MGRLEGKVCVITGGKEILAEELNFQRALTDLEQVLVGLEKTLLSNLSTKVRGFYFCGRGEAAGKEIEAQNGRNCVFVKADVMKEEDIKSVIDKAIELWGRIDCLFNNAGSNCFFDKHSCSSNTEL